MATKKVVKKAAKKPVKKKIVPKSESGRKREKKPPKEYVVGPGHPPIEHQFTSEKQPPAGVLKKAWAKKKFTREVIRELLDRKYQFKEDSKLRQQLVDAFGEDVLQLPAAAIGWLMQLNKAILSGDTQAMNSLTDQALGRAPQAAPPEGEDEDDFTGIRLLLPKGMTITFPSNTEGHE